MNARIFFFPDTIRIDYVRDNSVLFDESSDTDRERILSSLSISCSSSDAKDQRVFHLFVSYCFEIILQNSRPICGESQLSELKRLNSKTISCQQDSLVICVKHGDKLEDISQLDIQRAIVKFISDKVRNKDFKKIQFIYASSLQHEAVEHIKNLFNQEGIEIQCCRFEKNTRDSNGRERRRKDRSYFRSISMNGNQDSLSKYYESNVDLLASSSEASIRYEDFTLLCRIGEFQYVTLLDEVGSVKVYFPFSADHGGQMHLNIYIRSLILKDKFVGGIRLKCDEAGSQSKLPQYLMLVQCHDINRHLVFEIVVLDAVNYSKRKFYGDWEQEGSAKTWDYDTPCLDENCRFSLLPLVSHVVTKSELPVLYGSVYDLLGQETVKLKLNLLDKSSSTLSQTLPNVPPDDPQKTLSDFSLPWELISPLLYTGSEGVQVLQKDHAYLYVGYSSNMRPNGPGYIVSAKGELVCRGDFKDGAMQKGVRFDVPGFPHHYLQGSFANGRVVGDYTLVDKRTKMKYITAHMGDDSISEGTMYEYDRVVFSGTFKHFRPLNGTIFYLNGNKKYCGDIENSVAHGSGTFYFFEDQSNLTGRSACEPRKEYEGGFEKGLRAGNGVLYSKAGTAEKELVLYRGEFKNNVFHGNGVYFVSPIASMNDSKLVITEENEKYLDLWETGKKCSDILMFQGTFEEGHPLKGTVHFRDRANAEVEWKDGALVGKKIKNSNSNYRLFGDFTIRDWKITFSGPLWHGIRRNSKEEFNLIRTCIYDNERRCIKNYVIESNREIDDRQTIKRYEIVPLTSHWMWKYGASLSVDQNDPDYKEIVKYLK